MEENCKSYITLREKFDDSTYWLTEWKERIEELFPNYPIEIQSNMISIAYGNWMNRFFGEKSYYFREQDKIKDFPSLKKLDKYKEA